MKQNENIVSVQDLEGSHQETDTNQGKDLQDLGKKVKLLIKMLALCVLKKRNPIEEVAVIDIKVGSVINRKF